MLTKDQIVELLPGQRVAGYLARSAKLAELGATLRANGRKDKTWTEQETKEWEVLCDELDNWWYAMKEDEFETIQEVDVFLSSLCRGEYPPYFAKSIT